MNLAKWWGAMTMTAQDSGLVHQISVDMVDNVTHSRVHRLISEASPDMPPKGYFDCTVEVCHGLMRRFTY